MAYKTILTFLLMLNVLIGNAFGARDIPKKSSDKLQPNLFIDPHDGSVLVPGIGRYLVPKEKHNPFTYNPITGKDTGKGYSIPTFPTTPTGGVGMPSYIPGGDDNLIPNPGFEVPTGALPLSPPGRH